MLLLAWSTFRDRWQVFAGAIVTVCLGVALVQSSLLALMASAAPPIPPGLAEAEITAIRDTYGFAVTLLGMQLGLATFVAVFIVSSTFSFAVAQRRTELALLRLTGADRKQVRSLLIGEAVLLGLTGSAMGLVLGLPMLRLQVWMLEYFGFVPPGFEVPWRSWVAVAALATGVLIAVLGVLAASRRAAQVRPLEALRESGKAARVMTASRWVLGLLLTSGGVVLLLVLPGGATTLPVWFIQLTPFIVSVPLVVGFSALAPLIVPLVGRIFGLVLRGQLGELAVANLRSDARRSASTAAPIMVLIAFVASIGTTLASTGEAARQETLNTVEGDLVVTTDRPAASELASVDGVELASEETTILFELGLSEYDEVWYEANLALVADPAGYTSTRDVQATEGDLADLSGAAIAVSPSVTVGGQWQVGSTQQIRVDGVDHEVEIVALLPTTVSGALFLLPAEFAPAEAGPWLHIVALAAGADPGEVAARLAEFGTVATVEQWVSETAAAEEEMTVNIMVVLLGVTMLYTVIAMVNAVVISASDRRREFAVARVTGLRRAQVVRVAFWESQAVVAIGFILGGLAAAASILGVALAIENLIGTAVVSIPWTLLIGLGVGAVVVIAMTSIITTLSATRTPPIRLVAARE